MAVKYIKKGRPASKVPEKECLACAGSGYYDDHGSPLCGACGGTGKA